jgi:hypothetical protein
MYISPVEIIFVKTMPGPALVRNDRFLLLSIESVTANHRGGEAIVLTS